MNWMRCFVVTAVVCMFSVYSSQPAWAERKNFMIPPFQNFSPCKVRTEYEVTFNDIEHPTAIITKSFQIDQYSEAGRSLLENKLVNMGAKVIERGRIDQMLCESKFTRQNGYVNEESALEMGMLAGADTLLMGTILNIQDEEESITAYGLNEQIMKTICSIRARIIDIKSGNISFSETAKGEAVSTASKYGGKINSDNAYAALKKAIDNLVEKDSFQKIIIKSSN